jgi:hypothetical protein
MHSIKDTHSSIPQHTLGQGAVGFHATEQGTEISLLHHMNKINQALYMVTDLIDDTVSLRSAIRNTGISIGQTFIDVISTSKYTTLKHMIDIKNNLVYLMHSFDMLYRYHNVSQMNYQIIHTELEKIYTHVSSYIQEKESTRDSTAETLHTDFFKAPKELSVSTREVFSEKKHDNPISLLQEVTIPTEPTTVVSDYVIKDIKKDTHPVKVSPTLATPPVVISAKEKRHSNIINILKQKKDASINDICNLFKDCSSKTIQRDLIELIKNKKVVKRGDRRWSTYSLK